MNLVDPMHYINDTINTYTSVYHPSNDPFTINKYKLFTNWQFFYGEEDEFENGIYLCRKYNFDSKESNMAHLKTKICI